jgi:NADPH2:quinone reductase
MRAIRLHAFGPATNLHLDELPDPVPGPGQVRVAVRAAGVHLLDTTLRRGIRMGPAPLPELPAVPGREVAGVVDAVGPDVDPGWLGRRAVVHLGPKGSGGYAEQVLAEAASLHPVPDHVSDEAAVAAIGSGRTAVLILDQARLEPEDVVLVTAAAGGLGSVFVQAAKRAGATVVGLAGGPEKVALVTALGADLAVDYTEPGWPDRIGPAPTVLLDGVGGRPGRAALESLAPGGRILIFGWSAGSPTELNTADLLARSLTAGVVLGPALLRRSGGIRGLEERSLAAIALGEWTIPTTAFPLADAAKAHEALEQRATTGKVVLIP